MVGEVRDVKCLKCGRESKVFWGCTTTFKVNRKKHIYLPFICQYCGAEHLTVVDMHMIIENNSYEAKVEWFNKIYGEPECVKFMRQHIESFAFHGRFILKKNSILLLEDVKGLKVNGIVCY